MPLAALVYALILEVLVWTLLLPGLLVGVLTGKTRWEALRARMGWAPPRFGSGRPRVLVHGVSAGEVAAAEPLLRLLLESLPGAEVLLTTGNQTGLAAAAALTERLPGVRGAGLLPWDRAWIWRRWLRALDPELLVVMETELWPNLFLACRRMGIPLALVNGRIYPADLPRYRLIRGLMGRVLSCADLIGVQDGTEAERFLALGAPPARLIVGGNTKLDALPTPPQRPTRHRERAELLMVGGSTHPPEERWLLDAFAKLSEDFPGLRLVLAPRQPRRAPRIARAAAARGCHTLLESRCGDRQDWEVLVVDRMGCLPAWYGRADLAFIGGSLVRHGGHNVLEAALVGCPILVGPHTDHFAGIIARLCAREALVQLAGPAQLTGTIAALLTDEARRRGLAERALDVVAEGRGAARTYLGHLVALLPGDDRPPAVGRSPGGPHPPSG